MHSYLTTRIDKLEQAAGVKTRSNYCDCPVLYYYVGCDNAAFYANHPPCGKPIDREAMSHPSIYESRVIYPGKDRAEELMRPPAEGYSRVFVRDFC
jgi:hypothetical protein